MNSHWRIDTATKKGANAERVLKRVLQHLERQPVGEVIMEPQAESRKLTFRFLILLETTTWERAVFEVISLGQRLGYSWQLRGDIYSDVVLISTESKIVGVDSMLINLKTT